MDSDVVEDVIQSSQKTCDIIQPINRETVHRICSGQVVLSLAIAVKELVENAIDAGATIINISLREYGLELIEVSDNGTGVKEENFQALTLKHYTSKIAQFDDLSSLSTLGFRGEALSSLCALSDLSVLSKHRDAENATKITYDKNGKIISATLSAREQGTTVTLENLFSTLPVRRREFMKNLKREFNKMCQLLYAYCLVCKGIKFTCVNITNKGSKNVVVSTEGLTSVKENIINVFGSKQISSLIEIEMLKPEETILEEYGLKLTENEVLPFSFEFLISSVVHGSGRSTNDRQFFYINSRPCEPAKVTKLVNEIYKQYNNSQYPFVYLNIHTNSSLVDVNVTPDKRQIFLEKEKILLATIKTSLVEAFKVFPSTYKMQNLDLTQNSTIKDFFKNEDSPQRGIKRSLTDGAIKKGSILEKFKKRSKTENDRGTNKNLRQKFVLGEDEKNSQKKTDSDITENKTEELNFSVDKERLMLEQTELRTENTCSKEILSSQSDQSNIKNVENVKEENASTSDKVFEQKANLDFKPLTENKKILPNQDDSYDSKNVETVKDLNEVVDVEELKIVCIKEKGESLENIVDVENSDLETKIEQQVDNSKEKGKLSNVDLKTILNMVKNGVASSQERILDESVEILIDTTVKPSSNTKSVTLDVTMDDIKESMRKRCRNKETENDIKVRFRSKIDPESNKTAEEELRKQISKEDFAQMAIIGQFNLGFIVTKLHNDLFIIDQHATDEKYNFEQLQANTVIENQILLNPKPLQLTAAYESLLIENEDIFKKNGFTFRIDETAPCTKKISLTSVPLSKNIVFGKDDIDEVLFMLQDSNHTMYRPSRIRAMFASRACRKSVMIGKALSKSDMRKVVNHMGEIEQPWNCPHGRPTMRHLINLDLIHRE